MNSSALTEWIARHRRSLLFLLLLPVVAGIGAAFSLPVALFPNIQFPRVRISLDACDRPVQQMVLQVTTPVKQALLGIPRLTDVRSANEPWCRRDFGGVRMGHRHDRSDASGQRRDQSGHGAITARHDVDGTAYGSDGFSDHCLQPDLANGALTTLRDIGLFQLRPVLTSTACGIWVELRRRRQSRRFGERAARGRWA